MIVFSKSKLYMKISKSPMLVSGVLEKCIKTLFSTQGGNFRSKFLSRQAYQDAANHVLKSKETIV